MGCPVGHLRCATALPSLAHSNLFEPDLPYGRSGLAPRCATLRLACSPREPSSMKATTALATSMVLIIGLPLPRPSQAWNDFGHMLVAEIAYQQLEPSTRVKVADLLELNPDYDAWIE